MPTIQQQADKLQMLLATNAIVPAQNKPAGAVGMAPIPNYPNSPNAPLRGPIPGSYSMQPDQQRQWYNSATPQTRGPVNNPSGNPVVGAQAQTQAIAQIISTPAKTTTGGGGGGLSSVGLSMPTGYVVTNSPLVANGVISVTWAAEPQGYFLAAAPPGLSALVGTTSNEGAGAGSPSYPTVIPTITGTSTSTPGWAIYTSWSAGTNFSVPTGWTGFGNCAVLSIPTPTTVTATEASAATQTYGNALLFFAGTLPAQVQQASNTYSSSGGITSTCAVPFSTSNTAGNALMVVLKSVPGYPYNGGSLSFTDTAGNSYYLVGSGGYSKTDFNQAGSYSIYICPVCVGGSNTVNGTGNVHTGGGGIAKIDIYEFGTLQTGLTYPLFRPISPSDLPAIPASLIASGQVALQFGGTGANLQTTGGANQVVRQSSAGAAFTVGQLDYNNLLGSSLASQYNGVALVNLGLPSEMASTYLQNQSANISATNLPGGTLPSSPGYCRVSVYIRVTQAATISSTLPDVQILWKDYRSATVITSAPIVAASPSGNSLSATYAVATFLVKTTTTNIQYQVGQSTAYASSGATPMAYDLDIVMEQL